MLLQERSYSQESILLGIRRSKGEAADILRRLSVSASVTDILEKFQCTFGAIDTAESILRKFYACQQEENETVSKYSTRIEDIFSQAVEPDASDRRQDFLLKNVFYQGLHKGLRHAASFKFESIHDYDLFKVEVRKIKPDYKIPEESNAHCSAMNQNDSKG
ncbi:hypothetical protein DPMN_043062 [Dreissena polymorpha]|uniref:Paraneoplastic antigen Ma-like C-terminal domain-containing protein n=1 Tax=Dreissena polymorpha TaxID=45954 RepID=A0A9D4HXL1_DREPO|nr:hypothetical protein DPMN_043062 [Dreissena polymorpha]